MEDGKVKDLELCTAATAAQMLGISPSRIYQLARQLGLGRKLGRDWLFLIEEVNAMRVRGKPGRPRNKFVEKY
ncbi:helix-turn-helix domain-containing protein [Thermogutta sp.]|uniref:helix-turn-helix domain-containing protein n=1 Tax=Thermogutta sp. TaxID=1962930 RepID=UPI0032207A1E